LDQPHLSTPDDAIRVLHVDDEEDQLDFAKTFLAFCDSSIRVESVLTTKEALKRLEEGGFDCVVSDYQMPGMDGIELARRIRETSGIPIIIYTGRGSEEVAEAAFTVGIDDYIRKEMNPSHYQVLANRILQSVDKWRTGKHQRVLVRCLEVLNRPNAIKAKIRDLIEIIKEFTGIEAVGIRLKMGDDYPYFVTSGFSDEHLQMEDVLCAHDLEGQLIRDEFGNPVLECMCGNILNGRFDPALPFFTDGGSFWTNNTTELLATTTEEERLARTRNSCNAEGYESVALIPIPAGDENIGLLQLNDSRLDRFKLSLISFLEGLGGSIGMALSKAIVEDNLRSERDNAQRYLDIVGAMLVGLDREGRVTLLNRRASEVLGCDPEEALGRDWFDRYIPSRISEDLRQKYVRYMEGEGEFGERYENPVYTTSGGERTIAWVSIILRDDKGNAIGSLSSGADITDYRNLMAELKKSEANYRNLVETAGEAVLVVQDGILRYTNSKTSEVIGYSQEELASRPMVDFIHPEDREKVVDKSQRMLRGEDTNPLFSFRFIDSNGDEKHCEVNTVPITWEGKPATLNLLRDTTGIELMERRLETLHTYAMEISKATSIDDIADLTHQAVNAVLGFNRGNFSIVDGNHLVHAHLWGITPDYAEPMALDGPGVTVRAIRTGKSQLVNDTSNDPEYVFSSWSMRRSGCLPSPWTGPSPAVSR